MADETQNPNIVRPARNKPEPEESAPKGISGTAGWIYFLIAVLFDVIGALANGAAFIGSTGVMIIAYLFFIAMFFLFSGVNVFSRKYIFLFIGSLIIELIPVLNIFPATSAMVGAIVSKSRSSTKGGSIGDIFTLAKNKITRGKGATVKSNTFVERAGRRGGDRLAKAAQTRVALRTIKKEFKSKVRAGAKAKIKSDLYKKATRKITRTQVNNPRNRSSQTAQSNRESQQNKVLDLSNRQRDDDFSQAA